jgi:cystathionine beta-synthase
MSIIVEIIQVSDRDSFLTARRLTREEGIFAGGSTGTAVYGALKVAERLGPGKIVVVIICDSGDRYLSKLYDDEWMRDMGFLGPRPGLGSVREILEFKGGKVEFAEPDETLAQIAKRMSDLGFSQMPVKSTDGTPALLMIHEVDLLQSLVSGQCRSEDPVLKAAKPLQGQVTLDASLVRVQKIFDDENVAIAVDDGKIVGIISKIDVIEFLAARG